MASAKKCDRCGALYENTPTRVQERGEIKSYGIAWVYSHNWRDIDFCPKCRYDFKKWFEKGED